MHRKVFYPAGCQGHIALADGLRLISVIASALVEGFALLGILKIALVECLS